MYKTKLKNCFSDYFSPDMTMAFMNKTIWAMQSNDSVISVKNKEKTDHNPYNINRKMSFRKIKKLIHIFIKKAMSGEYMMSYHNSMEDNKNQILDKASILKVHSCLSFIKKNYEPNKVFENITFSIRREKHKWTFQVTQENWLAGNDLVGLVETIMAEKTKFFGKINMKYNNDELCWLSLLGTQPSKKPGILFTNDVEYYAGN